MSDGVAGAVTARRVKLFEGTSEEQTAACGAQRVQTDQPFIATVYTPMGCDDAAAVRARIAGEKPPVPFRETVAKSRGRIAFLQASKMAKQKEKATGYIADAPTEAEPAAAPEGPVAPEAELAAQLAVFAGDPEMQSAVFAKWQEKQAAKAVPQFVEPVGAEIEE